MREEESLPCIGLDILGSDADSEIVLESALPWMNQYQGRARFAIFCEQKNVHSFQDLPHISFYPSKESITMRDAPETAIRKKKDASMIKGLEALKKQQIQALISMGNTGALTLAAKIHLGTISPIKRPALLASIPSKTGNVAVLDVGANTSWTSTNLIDFSIMGIAYQKAQGISHPTIGLLNVGSESFKGTLELKEAYQKLSSHPLLSSSFKGNVEGKDIFSGKTDIVITDGFTGNIFLKAAEGVAHFLISTYKEQFPSDPMHLCSLQEQLETSELSGAVLTGINELVIKCHGSAHPRVFAYSLAHALRLIETQFILSLKQEISSFFFR